MRNRVAILHGINLGALDRRPAQHYGGLTFTQLEQRIGKFARDLDLQTSFFQSNHEGEYVEELHKAGDYADGLLLNPGAWTHYAWSLRDAVEISGLPAIEVHLSDVDAREPFRHVSVLEGVRAGKVSGKGPTAIATRWSCSRRSGMSRADRVAGRLADIDALLVTEPANLRYVTGFTGSNGFAVVGPDVRRFVTDFRYVEQAKGEVPDFDREQGPQELLGALSGLDGTNRLGFDDAHMSVRTFRRLGELLPDGVELVPAAGIVESARAVKEPGEVLRIGAAAALVDEIYGWLLEFGLVGRTEREVAVALEHEMRLRGASGPSFDSIVASAEHGALPHATPRDVAIAPDTLVTIDIGAVLDGYCSDCTRTWATGPVSDELAEIHALVLRAQVTALDAVRPGPSGRELDAVARDVIEAAGHGEHFGHGLGHGVGLVTHEAPRLARTAEARLEPGNVVTVEPGVYVPGVGGVRIEDLVVVTDSGRDVLSGTTKELLTVS